MGHVCRRHSLFRIEAEAAFDDLQQPRMRNFVQMDLVRPQLPKGHLLHYRLRIHVDGVRPFQAKELRENDPERPNVYRKTVTGEAGEDVP